MDETQQPRGRNSGGGFSIVRVGRRPRSAGAVIDLIRMVICFLIGLILLVMYWGTWFSILGVIALSFGLWFLARDVLAYRIERRGESGKKVEQPGSSDG